MRIANVGIAAALVVGIVFAIAGVASPILKKDDTTLTAFQLKIGDTTFKIADLACPPLRSRLHAIAAFGILTILFAVPLIAIAAAGAFEVFRAGTIGKACIGAVVLGVACTFWTTLVWILGANIYNTKFDADGCGEALKDSLDLSYGAGWVLPFLNTFIFSIGSIVFAILNRNSGFTAV